MISSPSCRPLIEHLLKVKNLKKGKTGKLNTDQDDWKEENARKDKEISRIRNHSKPLLEKVKKLKEEKKLQTQAELKT